MHHLSCFTLDDLQSGPLSQIWTQRTLRQFLRHPLRRPDSAPKLRRRYALRSAHPQSQKAWNWRSLQTLFLDELMRKALLLLYYSTLARTVLIFNVAFYPTVLLLVLSIVPSLNSREKEL
jgi:hypothetical protein